MQPLSLEHHQDLSLVTEGYWWHTHRVRMAVRLAQRFLTKPSLSNRYVDVGGGQGVTTRYIAQGLAEAGFLKMGPDQVTCMEGDRRLPPASKEASIRFITEDIESDPFPSRNNDRYHFFTVLDVLEHLEDPARFLNKLRTLLVPGAVGILTVPAYQWMFSEWDIQLGHKRRYTRRQLDRVLQGAGFTVRWSSYLFSYSLLPAWFVRHLKRGTSSGAPFPNLPSSVNALLKFCGRLEEAWTRWAPVPFGTSVIAVVQLKSE